MSPRLRRFGAMAVVVGVLAGSAALTIHFLHRSRANAEFAVPEMKVALPTGKAALIRGERLFAARGCAVCHGDAGRGQVFIDEAPLGRVVSADLRAFAHAPETNAADWIRAIRHGVRRDGTPLLWMPSDELAEVVDADVALSIGAYFRSLSAPVIASGEALPDHDLRLTGKALGLLGALPLFAAERIEHSKMPTVPEEGPTVAWGRALATGCRGCHGSNLSGGLPEGVDAATMTPPPNLTSHRSGLESWTEADLKRLLRLGMTPDGDALNPRQMPIDSFRHYSDTDIAALWAFLRSIPPLAMGRR